MADYHPNEITDMIMVFGTADGNAREAARRYREQYPDRRHPDHKVFLRVVNRARAGHMRRQRAKKSLDNDEVINVTVLGMAIMNPHISQPQISRELNLLQSSVHRILKANNYHPYHISLHQQLSDNDKMLRVRFCRWAQEQFARDPTFFDRVMFSDEATFQNTGELNRHNCHYYSLTNPHWVRHVDNQHRWKVNVWCGLLDGCIVGPYFIEGNLTGEAYLNLLQNELPEMLENINLHTVQNMWIQQDGAGAHCARIVTNFLNHRYSQRWIGRNGFITWPPRSPDLTSPDFYLWGYLKNTIYERVPTTPEDLKQRITETCRNIPTEILRKTIVEFRRRIQLCIDENGGTFEQLL